MEAVDAGGTRGTTLAGRSGLGGQSGRSEASGIDGYGGVVWGDVYIRPAGRGGLVLREKGGTVQLLGDCLDVPLSVRTGVL